MATAATAATPAVAAAATAAAAVAGGTTRRPPSGCGVQEPSAPTRNVPRRRWQRQWRRQHNGAVHPCPPPAVLVRSAVTPSGGSQCKQGVVRAGADTSRAGDIHCAGADLPAKDRDQAQADPAAHGRSRVSRGASAGPRARSQQPRRQPGDGCIRPPRPQRRIRRRRSRCCVRQPARQLSGREARALRTGRAGWRPVAAEAARSRAGTCSRLH
mmetsp:Transcript_34110/g.85865  ORF Transcript_34110/g.85865 Transcript_34110/m.85865 type:complete len:213 (+) Transcript_34110:1034-1672(+)